MIVIPRSDSAMADPEADAVLRFRAWMRDPDALTFIVHKPGSQWEAPNGRQMVIGPDGEPRPREQAVATC